MTKICLFSYNFNKENEAIHKQFADIAHSKLPYIAKHPHPLLFSSNQMCREDFLSDQENYENVLKFYDGLCKWEEQGSTQILHTIWASKFLAVITKFSSSLRANIKVEKGSDEETSSESAESSDDDEEVAIDGSRLVTPKVRGNVTISHHNGGVHSSSSSKRAGRNRASRTRSASVIANKKRPSTDKMQAPSPGNNIDNNNSVNKISRMFDVTSHNHTENNGISQLVSKVDFESSEESQNEVTDNKIADLAKACAESILNPEFLLGKGEPFTTGSSTSSAFSSSTTNSRVNFLSTTNDLNKYRTDSQYSHCISSSPTKDKSVFSSSVSHPSTLQNKVNPVAGSRSGRVDYISNELLLSPLFRPGPGGDTTTTQQTLNQNSSVISNCIENNNQAFTPSTTTTGKIPVSNSGAVASKKLRFESNKMKAMKQLLVNKTLNNNTIELQLTAQSQLIIKNKRNSASRRTYAPRKRTRRD